VSLVDPLPGHAEVPPVRFLHEAVSLSQPVTFHELPSPVGDLRSYVPLIHRDSLSSVISYPCPGVPKEEAADEERPGYPYTLPVGAPALLRLEFLVARVRHLARNQRVGGGVCLKEQ